METVMRAVLAPCPLPFAGCHRWRGAGRAPGDKLCSELSRVQPTFGQGCLDADSRATAGTICYFLSLSQIETLPEAGGDLSPIGTSPRALRQEQRAGTGRVAVLGQGRALHPRIEKIFCTSWYGPHLKKSQRRGQGAQASVCSPHYAGSVGTAPGSSPG